MSWVFRYPEIAAVEREAWESLGFQLQTEVFEETQVLQFKGSLRFEDETYEFIVHYPQGYPNRIPIVYCTSHSDLIHQSAVGNLCLYEEWLDYGQVRAKDMIPRLKEWLHGQKHGFGEGRESEAPEYKRYEWLSEHKAVIIAPEEVYLNWEEPKGVFAIRVMTEKDIVQSELVSITSSGDKISSKKRYLSGGKKYVGVCYNIDEAPPYFEESKEFYEWLESKGISKADDKASDLAARNPDGELEVGPLVGLRFKEGGSVRFVVFATEAYRQDAGRILYFPTIMFETQVISETALFSRVSHLRPLNKQHAVVVGVGAIGSHVALELAKAGIGKLTLVDRDNVTVGNVVRHVANLSHVGMDKTKALKEIISSHNPYIEVETKDEYWGSTDEENVIDTIRDADIVIVAVGHSPTERYIDDILRRNKVPAIYAYSSAGAFSGRIFLVHPEKGNCYHCHQYAIETNDVPRLRQAETAGEIYEVGCAGPAYPGSGIDTGTISLLVSRLVIQTLLKDNPESYEATETDHIYWCSQSGTGKMELVQSQVGKHTSCKFCEVKPDVNLAALTEEGNIILKACTDWETAKTLETGELEEASEKLLQLKTSYKGRTYINLQNEELLLVDVAIKPREDIKVWQVGYHFSNTNEIQWMEIEEFFGYQIVGLELKPRHNLKIDSLKLESCSA